MFLLEDYGLLFIVLDEIGSIVNEAIGTNAKQFQIFKEKFLQRKKHKISKKTK